MDRLPTEIKRTIAFHLLKDAPAGEGMMHIKQLHLVNKAYAIVAAEPLFSEIYLVPKSEDFERTREVSAHPNYAMLVKSIRYEPEYIEDYWNYHEGEKDEIRYREETEEYNAGSARAHQWLRSQYDLYRATFQDRQEICQREHDRALFAEVMARLPNPKQVILDSDIEITKQIEVQMEVWAEDFRASGKFPGEDIANGHPYAVTQLRAILLGAHDAGTKLRTLKCGKINWKFFKLPDKDMEKMKLALSHVESLQIKICVGHPEEAEAARCYAFLKNCRLCQFLSAAKNLRSLNIEFYEFKSSTELEYCVGQNNWTFLSTVQFNCFLADEDTLIAFLKRHAGTLRDLTLCAVRLVQGNWTSALPRVRDAVKLKDFCASNALMSTNLREHWCLNCHLNPSTFTTRDQMAQDQRLATAIREYVLFGGHCPLLDHVTYPPGAHDGRLYQYMGKAASDRVIGKRARQKKHAAVPYA